MKVHLLFQSLLESVHDSLYITNIRDESPSIRRCYCLWLDSVNMTLILKNDTNRHHIDWNMSTNVMTYNNHPQQPEFVQEIYRILQFVQRDLAEGNARVYKTIPEAA